MARSFGLTNDDQLAHALLSRQKRHVDKTYHSHVGSMTQEGMTFVRGIPLKDFTCQPAKLEDCGVGKIESGSP